MGVASACLTEEVESSFVTIRPLEDGDTATLLAVFEGLDARSRELRFMAPKFRLTSADVRQLTRVDGVDHVALVAELPDGSPVGIARFVRDECDRTSADVAVEVVEGWQRRGIGVRLAEALAEHARCAAIRRFTANMLRENDGASRLMRRVGGEVRTLEYDDHSAEFEILLTG
jgi:GNAT superfamily N-acetyltransferase